jgi:hypothetical protein
MAHVLAKIRGAKIDDIKKALSADSWKHAREGLSVEHVWQNADDAEEVQFLFSANDLEHAKKFISEVHAETRNKNPNANLPQMTFLDEEEGLDLDIEFEEGEKEEKEEEKKKKDESKKTDSASNGVGQISSLLKNAALLAGGLAVGITVGVSFGNANVPICEMPEIAQQEIVAPATVTPRSTGSSQVKSTGTKAETAVPSETKTTVSEQPAETPGSTSPRSNVPAEEGTTSPEESSDGTMP